MKLLNDPAARRSLLVDYSEKVIAVEGRVAVQAPKVEALGRIAECDGSLCVRDAAKSLQMRPIDLTRYLVANRWIYKRAGRRDWSAYQSKIITGLAIEKVTAVPHDDGHDRIRSQIRITPKGLARLVEEFALAA